ncbi:hypothetical protein M9H77_36981 [Catharanthus roseus]|uniref:Uncharacterized protein n=1 Tax=Catharanthus roseus TaxID=4058 RepID=A0ACB9ZTB0_CATRO|nr:hypothetical protein M9H77_36981 [Catharanthus roseus]
MITLDGIGILHESTLEIQHVVILGHIDTSTFSFYFISKLLMPFLYALQTMNMDATHPISVVLFWDSEHAKDVFSPYFTRAVKKTWTFTLMVTHDQLVRKTFKHQGMNPNRLSKYGSEEQIDDLIESCTIILLDWNDPMTDLQFGIRDPCLKRYPISPSITPDGLYVQESMYYMVKSSIRLDGRCNIVCTLKMNEKSCSCGKWQEYTLPFFHAIVVYKDNGTRLDAYVPDIYS